MTTGVLPCCPQHALSTSSHDTKLSRANCVRSLTAIMQTKRILGLTNTRSSVLKTSASRFEYSQFSHFKRVLTSLLIKSKADEEVSSLFECDEFGDIGVNGGDKSRVCDRFLLPTTCLNVAWFGLLAPSGSN